MIPKPTPEYEVVWSGRESLDKFQAKLEDAPKPRLSPLAEFFHDVRYYPRRDHCTRNCPSCHLAYVVTNSKIEHVCEGCWTAPKEVVYNKRYETVCVVCGREFQGTARSKYCAICRKARRHSSRVEKKLVAQGQRQAKQQALKQSQEHQRRHEVKSRQEATSQYAKFNQMRSDVYRKYDRDDCPGYGEYFVAVYEFELFAAVNTPCPHRHNKVFTAVWCNWFPSVSPPKHVVVVSSTTDQVIRSLTLQ